MVGDDAVRDRMRPVRRHAGGFGRGQDQRAEKVDVVIVVLALQDRGDAFEPHAGIDRGARQRDPLTRAHLVELREDEVPDFDEAVAFRIGTSRRAPGNGRAVIVEDLRARAARPDVAHHPEIVRGGDADDLRLRQPGDLRPQSRRLVVFGVDRHQQAIAGEPELAGDQVPGQLDRPVLEIIAKREIPEHLEKGVMPGGIADVFQIVVLAAGAHAFLRRGGALIGPLLQAGEDVLELNHSGIGEQQCRIVARHERARRDDLVAVAREIVEKRGADVVGRLHGQILALGGGHTRGAGPRYRSPRASMSRSSGSSARGKRGLTQPRRYRGKAGDVDAVTRGFGDQRERVRRPRACGSRPTAGSSACRCGNGRRPAPARRATPRRTHRHRRATTSPR